MFEDMIREYEFEGGITRIEALNEFDREELVGAFLAEYYPKEALHEPVAEVLTQEWCGELYKKMSRGFLDDGEVFALFWKLTDLLIKGYAESAQKKWDELSGR